jgi:hypothetical protein
MFPRIPDPGSGFFSIPDPGQKNRIPDPCKQNFAEYSPAFCPRSTFSLSDKMYSGEEGGSFKRMRFSEDNETTQRRKVSSNEVFECRPLFGFCVFFFGELFFLAFCPFSNYLPVLLKQDLEIFVLYA